MTTSLPIRQINRQTQTLKYQPDPSKSQTKTVSFNDLDKDSKALAKDKTRNIASEYGLVYNENEWKWHLVPAKMANRHARPVYSRGVQAPQPARAAPVVQAPRPRVAKKVKKPKMTREQRQEMGCRGAAKRWGTTAAGTST